MLKEPVAKALNIKEQIIEDEVTGLTFQFEQMPDGTPRLRVFGDMGLCDNREFVFDEKGRQTGAGCSLTGVCRPSWMTSIDEIS